MSDKRKKKVRRNLGLAALAALILSTFLATFYPAVHPVAAKPPDTGNIAWMLMASAMVLLMTPGLSFFYGGMVRPKNIISTMLQSFMALGIITFIWYVFGFSLAFGKDIGGFIGNPSTYFMMNNVGSANEATMSPAIPFILFAAFQLKFAIITPALITGSFAERIKFGAYLIFMCLFSVFIYCPIAHWVWHPDGFLHKWGVLDFAGGTVVHISSGVAALAGAMFIGKRKNEVQIHGGANVPYILLGTGLLWFGWFGFNAGSALEANSIAALAFVNTNLASAIAMVTWMICEGIKGNKPSATGACIGAVVGLVAVTPAAGYVDFSAAVFIGFISSVICNWAVHIKTKSEIDDTLDVFPCHGIGGIVGTLATAVFATEGGLIHGKTTLFVYHVLGLVIVVAFAFFGSMLIYWVTNKITPIRVSTREERIGLDISQHNESVQAYEFDYAINGVQDESPSFERTHEDKVFN